MQFLVVVCIYKQVERGILNREELEDCFLVLVVVNNCIFLGKLELV